jgi:hypothetical protein
VSRIRAIDPTKTTGAVSDVLAAVQATLGTIPTRRE